MVTVVVLRTPRLKPRREHREKAAYFLLPFFFYIVQKKKKKIIFSKRNLGFKAVLSAHSILLSAFPSAALGRAGLQAGQADAR